jgi:hypothetical protein
MMSAPLLLIGGGALWLWRVSRRSPAAGDEDA